MKRHLLILFIVIPTLAFGQPKLSEKFVNDSYNENNYLVFYPDSTFKYRLAYELFHDISCGRYKTVKDTIFLSYETDLRDTTCNKLVDAETHFDSTLLSLRLTKLYYKDDRLYEIENGQILSRTRKEEIDWEVSKGTRKFYHRKYWLFGPLVTDSRKAYYMVIASKAKWKKASW